MQRVKKGLCLLLTMCLLISCALAEVAGLEDFRAQQETIRQQQEALQLEMEIAQLEAEQARLECQLAENAAQQEELRALMLTLCSDGELVGTARGFQSEVTATILLDGNGVIRELRLDTSGETRGFGTRVMEDASFISQFIGQRLPVDERKIDGVSGATVTSRAVVSAINAAEARQAEETTEQVSLPDWVSTGEGSVTHYGQGTVLTGSASGFGGDVSVTLTLNMNGTIDEIEVDMPFETPGIGSQCGEKTWLAQFIGRKGPFVIGENIDVATSATFTSRGIVEAVNKALGYE